MLILVFIKTYQLNSDKMIISDPDQILYGYRIYKFKKDVIVLEMALYSLNNH